MSRLFRVVREDDGTRARCGLLQTSHGSVETPVFMPVGTAATVKAVPQEFLERLGVSILLANTYHLHLRPGVETIRNSHGLHRFMSWRRPILTDSGGYQVFSHQALRKISEEGVEFQSHIDGTYHFFSPEKSIELQQVLGADIITVLDECIPYPVMEREARDSMRRSIRWARRCKNAHRENSQTLFGIVQGGVFFDLRRESLERLCEIDFPGLALGGFGVGEPRLIMYELIERLGCLMPVNKPRYVMGVGTPLDLISCVKQGIDMFDCVLPTRNARNGTVYTSFGKISLKNSRYRNDENPLDSECECFVCRRYSRAYLRHLYVSGEILSSLLNTYHNLYFYLDLMREIRESIALNSLEDLEKKLTEQYSAS